MDVFTNDEQYVVVTGVSAFHEQSTMVASLFLWIPLFCFALFLSFSLSLSLSRFSGLFSTSIFFFFSIHFLARYFFFKKKENHYWVARKFKQFGIQHYRNFMRFIIFTIELSIVNLILSKTK